MTTERVVIGGGPRTGKSWLAREMATESGAPRFCGDPRSKVKDVFGGVTYLPEGLAMEDESTRWIVEHWFTMPGPWICEGWIMARALRKWMELEHARWGDCEGFPCDRIIVFEEQREDCDLKPGQVAMHRGVMTVWREIEEYYSDIVELR